MRIWGIITVLAIAIGLSGCAANESHVTPHPAVKVTTRQGLSLVVVDPVIDYQHVCFDGAKIASDNEPRGLRLRDEKVVSWTSLGSVEFGKPQWHDQDDYCQKLPSDFKATLVMADGSHRAVELQNPTDYGLEGQTERGMVLVRFANIAKLAWLGKQNYPWIRSLEDLDGMIAVQHLPQYDLLFTDGHHIRITDGATIEYIMPQFSDRTIPDAIVTRELEVPNMESDHDIPANISGAKFSVRWKEIKEVDIKGQHAHVVLKTGPIFDGDLPDDADIQIPGRKVPMSTLARITLVPDEHP
jgi:hypothetical protein